MTVITIPQSYRIDCPPTHLNGAAITFIGEAPGHSEVMARKGFVGASGKMLLRICKSVSIDFEKCSITNVIKRIPTGGSFESLYVDKKRTEPTKELIWWRELLIAELQRYRPHLVVAMGNEALRALTDKDGITKWRGSILLSNKIEGLKVIPELHPSYIMRDNWAEYYVAIRNFKRVEIESKSAHIISKEPPEEFIIRPNLQQVLSLLKEIATNNQPWYLDVETVGDSLRCFGLSTDAKQNKAMCIPLQTTTGPYWSVSDEAQIWAALSKTALLNPQFRNQNCLYDLDYLLDMGVEPSRIDFDPMVGMNVAFPELPKGLDFTTMLFTNYPYYKDEGKTWKKKEPDDKVFTYNCKDQLTTPKVSNAILHELKEKHLYELYYKRSNSMLPIGLEMQRNRLLLHEDWYSTLKNLLESARISKHNELTGVVGYDLNVKSNKEVSHLLFETLRLPTKLKRGSDSITTDENALKELRAMYPDIKELNLILEERHLRTKWSNYINVEFDAEGSNRYLPYMANIAGTKTGRWSFSKSPKWRGSSPQTLPKVMRLMYQPPLGSVFFQRDLSQAEARMVAWLSDCRFLLDTFASPIKIHKVVGGKIFSKPPNEILTDSMEYDIAKRVVHAYDYMMGYKKLAITANVSLNFAKFTLEEYGKQVPEIAQWHRRIKETVIKTGRLVTPMGRVRECFKAASALTHTGQLPDEILRDLVSYIPQSTVPDLTNEAMLQLYHQYPNVRWHQQGHDSFLASGPPSLTQEFYEAAERAANIHFIINGRDCHIPGEFQFGYLWGAMLKYIPGEDTSYQAWEKRATAEGYFELEGPNGIKSKLISLLT